MNLVVLKGRLGADPELRYTQSGTAVCNFRICTSYTFKDKNGVKQENAEWHSCSLWQSRGEAFAKYNKKGAEVLVRGRLHYSTYEDKDGIKRYKTEIVVEDWEFCGSKKDSDNSDDDRPSSSAAPRGNARPASSQQAPAQRPAPAPQSQSNDDAMPADDFPTDFIDDSIPF
jgi:single-strand DNA-binding protein